MKGTIQTVSYTHLDVYKRQQLLCKISDLSCNVFAVGRPESPELPLKCGKDCGTEIPPVLAVWFPNRESNFMALTVLKVKNAKPGRHVDGRGLCLVVKPSGSRTWVLRMQLNGQRRDYGMGSAYDVPLADALSLIHI